MDRHIAHAAGSRRHALGVLASFCLVAGFLVSVGVSELALALAGDLTVSPASGPPTTRIRLSGSGFDADESVELSFGNAELAEAVADANGTFTGVGLRVPRSAKPGDHSVSALGLESGARAEASFLVRTDWRQFRFTPTHHALNPYENVLSASNVGRLRVDWTFRTGDEVESSPAVVDGVVYIGSQDGKLYALDASTGDLRWSYQTDGGIVSSPAVIDGVVYVGSMGVYALDASTGDLLWRSEPDIGFPAAPAVLRGVLYIGSTDDSGRVYALDASTGEELWSSRTGGWLSSPAVANGTVYVTSTNHFAYALDASSGDLLWRYRTPSYILASPVIANGAVYVGTSRFYALDASTGAVRWSRDDVGGSAPAVAHRVVYLGTDDRWVLALRASTGDEIWSYDAGFTNMNDATMANGVVYVGADNFKLYALDASTGAYLWSYRTGGKILPTPAVVDGRVYVGSRDGRVYAFGLP